MMKIPEIKLTNPIIRREEHEYSLFKVTPHITTLNSTTRKFQSSIYQLFSYRYPKYPWQRKPFRQSFSKGNKYISLKGNPKFLWWVKMSGLEPEQSKGDENKVKSVQLIEFYMAVPSDFKEAFITKFNNHEQWRKSTIEEVEGSIVLNDSPYTDTYALRYLRNDMFSLKYDYSQQNAPIRDIMSVSKELSQGEEVHFIMASESISRKRWRKLVDYYWEIWDKGKVPTKQGLNPSLFVDDLKYAVESGFYEVKGIFDDIIHGVSTAFFNDKGEKPKVKKVTPTYSERQALLVDGELSRMTRNKRNLPAFKTSAFFTVSSPDAVRRDMLARSMSNSFTDLNGDNALKGVKVNIKAKDLVKTLENKSVTSANSLSMSVDEIGKLQQLPTADLQREFQDSFVSNSRIEVDLDKELLDERGIYAGYTKVKGVTHNLHIQTKNKDLNNTARAFIGSPRMGKDQAVINLVVEGKRKHNKGAIVLDVINEKNGHRGMGDAIRDHLPPEDVIDLNLMDYDNPIYLGLEPIVKLIKNPRIAADRVAEELCSFLLQDGDEDKLQTADHLREASKLTNGDILGIKHLFTSEHIRKKLVKEKSHLFDTDIWEQYNNLSEGKQQAIYVPIMRRIGQIMNSEFLKPIFCQRPNPELDLYNLIDEGKVIIFRMKSGIMSQRVIEILTYWIVLISFLIKLGQDGNSKKNNGTYLVLNEPHQYLTDGLAHFIERIFAEGPKYTLSPVLIFHNFKQFKKFPGFVDMMKSASLNWHIFKNTNGDVYKELYNEYLSRTFDSPTQAFESTAMYQFIGLWLNSNGGYYDPFVADSPPLVSSRYPTLNNAYLTEMHSKKYGKPVNEVLKEIKARNKEALKKPEKVTSGKGKKY